MFRIHSIPMQVVKLCSMNSEFWFWVSAYTESLKQQTAVIAWLTVSAPKLPKNWNYCVPLISFEDADAGVRRSMIDAFVALLGHIHIGRPKAELSILDCRCTVSVMFVA
jgi:hypothetical protein